MALGLKSQVPDAVLFNCLIDSISARILRQAMHEVSSGNKSFSQSGQSSLAVIPSQFNIWDLPTPQNFKDVLVNIAKYEFIAKPIAAILIMNSGIPS